MFEDALEDYQEEWVDNPDFGNRDNVKNWRNYISDEEKEKWYTLTAETRRLFIIMAEKQADAEEWD